MVDFNDIFQKELRGRRERSIFTPSTEMVGAEKNPIHTHISVHTRISIDETNEETSLNAEYGPQQVQSLLSLVVDLPLNKRMKDAGDDADAFHHLNKLNSHRGG